MKSIVIISVALTTSLAAWAYYQQTPSKAVGTVEAFSVSHLQPFTDEDVRAMTSALVNGHAMPPGWQITSMEGKVHAVDTGMRLVPTGEQLWTVTVMDDSDDLEVATVSINGQVIETATRANGKVKDRSGMAIATMGVVVPPEGQSWQGKVEWTDSDGTVRLFEGPLGG